MTPRRARQWLGVLVTLLPIALIASLPGCAGRVAAPPVPARRAILLVEPVPGDTIIAPGFVRTFAGCTVYLYRLKADSTQLRATLRECQSASARPERTD